MKRLLKRGWRVLLALAACLGLAAPVYASGMVCLVRNADGRLIVCDPPAPVPASLAAGTTSYTFTDSTAKAILTVDASASAIGVTGISGPDANGQYVATPVAISTRTTPPPPQGCQFTLGFQTLHDLDPTDIGDCVDNQAYAGNGDAQQHTTKGLMAWRKADNWTAFTNGYMTWLNGPDGLVSRLNSDRFPWETASAAPATPALATAPTFTPMTKTTLPTSCGLGLCVVNASATGLGHQAVMVTYEVKGTIYPGVVPGLIIQGLDAKGRPVAEVYGVCCSSGTFGLHATRLPSGVAPAPIAQVVFEFYQKTIACDFVQMPYCY